MTSYTHAQIRKALKNHMGYGLTLKRLGKAVPEHVEIAIWLLRERLSKKGE